MHEKLAQVLFFCVLLKLVQIIDIHSDNVHSNIYLGMSCKYSERIVFSFLHFQVNHYNVHVIIFLYY